MSAYFDPLANDDDVRAWRMVGAEAQRLGMTLEELRKQCRVKRERFERVRYVSDPKLEATIASLLRMGVEQIWPNRRRND